MSEYRMWYLEDCEKSRHALRGVFALMEEQRLAGVVYHDGTVRCAAQFTADVLRPGSLPFLAFAQDVPAAFVWLNTLEGRAARGHFVFFKDYWGRKKSVPLGRFLFEYLLTRRDARGYLFDVLVGITPASNPLAWRRAVDCGARLVGTIPCFAYMAATDSTQDAVAVAVTRASLGIAEEVRCAA